MRWFIPLGGPGLDADVRLWRSVHLAALVVAGFALLAYASRGWFFFDDWEFLTSRGFVSPPERSLFAPHAGVHLSVFPILIYRALFAVFGLHTYVPYLIVAIVIHLAIVHLVRRLLIASGASESVATLLSVILLILGTPSSQTYLWAFQIGYLGSFGLVLLMLVIITESDSLNATKLAGLVLIGLASMGFSATGLFVLPAVFVLAWFEGSLWKGAVLAGVPASAYGVWYASFGAGSGSQVVDRPLAVVDFLILGLEGSLDLFLGAGGAAILVLLVLGLVTRRDAAPVAYACIVGVVSYFVGVGLGRASDLAKATSGRYLYVGFVLLLPLIGVLLSDRLVQSWTSLAALVIVVGVSVFHNLHAMFVVGSELHGRMETSRSRIMEAAIALQEGREVPEKPDSEWAPDLDSEALEALITHGALNPTPPGHAHGEREQTAEPTGTGSLGSG